jgi:hypothetical protein
VVQRSPASTWRSGQRDRTDLQYSPERACCDQHRLHRVLNV